MDYTLIKLTAGALATLGLYTVLYRENKIFRLFEHLFLGLAAGYTLFIIFTTVIKDIWWDTMIGSPAVNGAPATPGYWLYALLLPFALMAYFVFNRKHNWISRIPIGFLLGLAAGQIFFIFWNRYGPQLASSMVTLWPTTFESITVPITVDLQGGALVDAARLAEIKSNVYPTQALTNLISVITLFSVLSYFLFSFELKGKFMTGMTTTGRWLLMIGFGAIFGSTVMMRFTLLIDRMYYVWVEWFQQGILG